METLIPRPFQELAVQQALESSVQRQLIVSPGGSGKTVMIAMVAADTVQRRKRVLIISHRRELVLQTRDHLHALNGGSARVGLLLPGLEEDLSCNVQVGSIQTLHARGRYPQADVLIIDEAHHTPADSYGVLLSKYPSARVYGFTATPIRLDGKGLGDFYESLYTAASADELIQANFLAAPRVFTASEEFLPDLARLRSLHGDYQLTELNRRVDRGHLIGNIIDNYQKYGHGKRGLVFAVSVAHSEHIVERFNAAGVTAAHLDGRVPVKKRDALIEDFAAGRVRILSNCMVLCEGFDLPSCDVVILARPTQSLALYVQQAARAMRVHGAIRPIILDHARNVHRFGLPHADRAYTLDGEEPGEGTGVAPCKICPECNAVVGTRTQICPECDYTFPLEDFGIPAETDDTLQEVTEDVRARLEERLRTFLSKRNVNDPAFVEKALHAWEKVRGKR